MGFKVEIKGDLTLKEDQEKMFSDWKTFKKDFIYAGRNIHQFMIEYLKANIKGTSNASNVNLHKEIKYEYLDLGDSIEISIGDIDTLKAKAPWWYLINYGGAHPLAKYPLPKDRFVPGSKLAGEYKSKFPNGMVVGTDAKIEPINYIENTENFGTAELQMLIEKSSIEVN